MFDRIDCRQLNDLMLPLSGRSPAGVYFVRVPYWSEPVGRAVWAYHEAARRRGVILEGAIPNPDERQLGYYSDVLGADFAPDETFVRSALAKWVPRLSDANRAQLAGSMCALFEDLRRQGKTDSILRNVYIKLMCWLYYRFERIMPFLGEDEPPKILYECPAITRHELLMLRLMNGIGADVMLLEPQGDGAYLRYDAQSAYSQRCPADGAPFPEGFSLKRFRREMAAREAGTDRAAQPAADRDGASPRRAAAPAGPAPVQRNAPAKPAARIDPYSYFKKPATEACTNAWMKSADYRAVLTPARERGDDLGLFCNAFIRMSGTTDKVAWPGEMHQLYQALQAAGRRVVVVDGGLEAPGQEEIARIRRRSYRNAEEMAVGLAGNLPACASVELQRLEQRAFVRTVLDAQREEPALNRLLTAAVYLLCWIKRYQGRLFEGYRDGDIPCFILMGGCRSAREALYPRFLSHLPVDVLILAPDLDRRCALRDDRLLELDGPESLRVDRFPRDAGSLQVQTLAAHAEEDLTSTLYADSGIYRNRQFARADALTLRTTYDELFLLWDQELRYRSGFGTVGQTVTMPVIYAKISGVEGGKVDAYWQRAKLLMTDGAYVVRRMPMLQTGAGNPYQSIAVKAVRNGVLQRELLRGHRQYPFGIIRQELQEHIFDKLQLMLDRRLIRGTFENGTEYTVVATVLNMDKALVRMLQSFDFTRRNPKVVCIAADDRGASLEDAIMLTFLNLVGFDIAMFVPTGYQVIERFLNDNGPVEHQAGEYIYDLTVPDFDALPPPKGRSWLKDLLKRGT